MTLLTLLIVMAAALSHAGDPLTTDEQNAAWKVMIDPSVTTAQRHAAEDQLATAPPSFLPVLFVALDDDINGKDPLSLIAMTPGYPRRDLELTGFPAEPQIAYARLRLWQHLSSNAEPADDRRRVLASLFPLAESHQQKLQLLQSISAQNWSPEIEQAVSVWFLDRSQPCEIRTLAARSLVNRAHKRWRETVLQEAWSLRDESLECARRIAATAIPVKNDPRFPTDARYTALLDDPVARAAEIPFAPPSFDCAPETFEPVRRLLGAFTREDTEILLTSDNAHARGVAIFVASDRQYFDLLLQHPQLADDRRPSIPNLICTPHRELPPAQVPKTVQARYLDSIQFWFGTSGSTSERQSALFPPDVPASRYAHPWTRRIELAVRADEKTKVALRNEVRSLPSDLRWVVLSTSLPVEGVRELFTEAEIREEMKRLDNGTARAILSGTAKLPPDPQYQKPNAGEGLMRVAEALINDKPLPDPYDSLPEHIKEMIVDR